MPSDEKSKTNWKIFISEYTSHIIWWSSHGCNTGHYYCVNIELHHREKHPNSSMHGLDAIWSDTDWWEVLNKVLKNSYPRIFDIQYIDHHEGVYECANIELNHQEMHPNSRIHGLDVMWSNTDWCKSVKQSLEKFISKNIWDSIYWPSWGNILRCEYRIKSPEKASKQ